MSNIDNTGACLDLKIAQFFVDQGAEYAMECTEKTQSDIKVSPLIKGEAAPSGRHSDLDKQPADAPGDAPGAPRTPSRVLFHLRLQVICLHNSIIANNCRIFNTNNIWVNLRAVKERLPTMKSEIIVNKKVGLLEDKEYPVDTVIHVLYR